LYSGTTFWVVPLSIRAPAISKKLNPVLNSNYLALWKSFNGSRENEKDQEFSFNFEPEKTR
jgi:hypothetical protein